MKRSKKAGASDLAPAHGVGYGRPPVSSRWKRGQSGNPKGRKKSAKTVAQSIEETLARRLTIEENGRPVTLTLQEIVLRKLAYAAARGDMNAIKTLFALKDRFHDSSETKLDPAELDPNDQAIIAGYLEKLKGSANAGDAATAEGQAQEGEDVGEVSFGPPIEKGAPG